MGTILSRPLAPTTVLLWLFGFFSLGTQLLIAQYLPTLLQLPVPGLNTVQSSTIVGVYGLASVLGGVVVGAILARVSRFLVIGIVLGLAAVVSVVVYLLPDPGFGSLIVVLGITGFILPTAFGPTRSVLAAMAYPANIRGAGIGVAEFGGRWEQLPAALPVARSSAPEWDSRACSLFCCCPSACFLVR